MPRNARKGRRRSSRKKKVLRLSRSQARSKRYDSLVEKVAARVARQEISKAEVTLISREFLFGSYDANTYSWTGGLHLDYAGTVIPLANIPLADININASQGITDIPETMDDESAPAGVGIAHGSLTVPKHGTRSSDFIKIKGFSFKLRALMNKRVEATVPTLDSCVIKWRLVSVRGDDAFVAGWEPTAHKLLPMPSFGYSNKLDRDEQQDTADLKVRVLAKGRMFLRCSVIKTDVKERSWYRSFQKPILVKYKPGDQGGETHENVQVFLVMRANIPLNGTYDDYRPTCFACSKVFYTDA